MLTTNLVGCHRNLPKKKGLGEMVDSIWKPFCAKVTGDVWSAEMVSTFLYVIENPRCSIPDDWEETMVQFHTEMKRWVPGCYQL